MDFDFALTILLSLPLLILLVVWIGSFFVLFFSVIRLISLSGTLKEEGLSWGGRAAQQNEFTGRIFTDPAFAADRKRFAWSAAIAIGGMAVAFLFALIQGKL